MDRSKEHDLLVRQIVGLSAGRPDLILFEFKVGAGISCSGGFFKYGTNGVSDIIGIVGPLGKFVAIEVKTGLGRLTREQMAFQSAVIRNGGLYFVARTFEDTKAWIACVSE